MAEINDVPYIDSLKDNDGNTIYPNTLEKAIFDSKNRRMDVKLSKSVFISNAVPTGVEPLNADTVSGKNIEYIMDYNNLANKPISASINDIELVGNKTSDDLGLQPKGDYSTKNELDTHKDTYANTENGTHGLRYFNDKLSYWDGTAWVEIKTGGGGGGGMHPSNVINPRINLGNTKIDIYWKDPNDTVIDNQLVCTWKGTKLVRKDGSFPENESDGVVLIDNQERNKYVDIPFELTGLTNGVTYYFALFPYSDQGVVNKNPKNRLSGAPDVYQIMTAKIDFNISNPETSVTYADNATGMIPKSEEWDKFFGHYPVLFKDGQVVDRLDPNDFSKFVSGSDADITSGNAGDVMICFPKLGVRIKAVGNIVTVSMTNNPNDANFKYYAHTKGNIVKDNFYLGAYKGSLPSIVDKPRTIRSLSNMNIQTGYHNNISEPSSTRGYAQLNGDGYEQSGFYQLLYRQCMYILKYKDLNSQIALGKGYCVGNSAMVKTGGTDQKGMDFGETTGKLQMKLFGIEDTWGNAFECIDGIVIKPTYNMYMCTNNIFNDESKYTYIGYTSYSSSSSYIKKILGLTELGFISLESTGSNSTYFCDTGSNISSLSSSTYGVMHGGSYGSSDSCGIFNLLIGASGYPTSYAGRLMYL